MQAEEERGGETTATVNSRAGTKRDGCLSRNVEFRGAARPDDGSLFHRAIYFWIFF